MIIASFPKGSFPENSWPVGTWPVAPAVVDIQYTEVMEFAVCIATSAEFDVIMPNDEFVNVTGAGVEVNSAGTAAVNGIYAVYGTRDGKVRYRMASAASVSGYFYIVWIEDYLSWIISRRGEDATSDIIIASGSYYISTDAVTTPDLCTNWTQGSYGLLPVPTDIISTIPTLTEVATFTVEMPMIIDFELYEELST
jgi:hypothetical protein